MSASVLVLLATLLAAPAPEPSFRTLAPGVEHALVTLPKKPAVGAPLLHVIRLDPVRAELSLKTVTREGGENRTAGQWCEDAGAIVAINAGMFATDHRTHVGHLSERGHVNSQKWNQYQSVLLFSPVRAGHEPRFLLIDREDPELEEQMALYAGVSQNLRLIRAPGQNVWKNGARRWSEAAIATDDRGRLLLLFTRAPYSMPELNAMLLELPLGITRAQHLEGGPEASLSIRAPGVKLDLAGSFETGFFASDANQTQWPLPSVFVVASRRR